MLEDDGRLVGSVFVEPASRQTLPELSGWGLDDPDLRLWHLHKLMIEPEEQGRGLGSILVDAVKEQVASRGGTIVLDCWAGNEKLRDFYTRAGFRLHGVFPEDGYEIAVFTWDSDWRGVQAATDQRVREANLRTEDDVEGLSNDVQD